ncbi:MAG: hypothetical protein ACKOTB_00790, partial [Planctomycetia bacterium]
SYAVALKQLCITGKDIKPVKVGTKTKAPAWLTKQEVAEAIAAGRFEKDQKNLSVQELTKALGNWSPTVRCHAAWELAKRPGPRCSRTRSNAPPRSRGIRGKSRPGGSDFPGRFCELQLGHPGNGRHLRSLPHAVFHPRPRTMFETITFWIIVAWFAAGVGMIVASFGGRPAAGSSRAASSASGPADVR